MEVKINNKELIKRAKELVKMIEDDEVANGLLKKLSLAEGEIAKREEFEIQYKNRYKLLLEDMVRKINHGVGHLDSILQIQFVDNVFREAEGCMTVRLSSNNIVFEESERYSTYLLDKNLLSEKLYRKIIIAVFQSGLHKEEKRYLEGYEY